MSRVTYTPEGIVKVDGKIVGAMYNSTETNLNKVLIKHYWQRFKNEIQEWCNAAANFN